MWVFKPDFCFLNGNSMQILTVKKMVEEKKNQGDHNLKSNIILSVIVGGVFFIVLNKICPSVIELSPLYPCYSEEQKFEYTRSLAAYS